MAQPVEQPTYRRKKRLLPVTIFRLFLTLILLFVFAVGLLSAFRYFSGIDLLSLSPQAVLNSTLSTPEGQKLAEKTQGYSTPSFLNPLVAKYLKQNSPLNKTASDNSVQANSTSHSEEKVILTFAEVADSHNDNQNLEKALSQAKQAGAQFVIGLGDYSDVGTSGELEAAKSVFDQSGLPYYVTAGDHDLWDDRDKGRQPEQTFKSVFGIPYKSFAYGNNRFILLDNSDDYLGMDSYQIEWFQSELNRVVKTSPKNIFVFLHEPLYHPSSDHIMGKTNPQLASQASQLITMMKEAKVSEVFAGDIHYFTTYVDPSSELHMTTVGAITSARNVQSPRFLLVDVYSDGSYNIYDTEIK